MSKHTPGHRMDIALGAGVASHQVMVVAHDTGAVIVGMSKDEAIRRLLSAPDMLAALKEAHRTFGPFFDTSEEAQNRATAMIEAAIAKAEA
jgi:hypothetical protein